jgi:hypothetical protein
MNNSKINFMNDLIQGELNTVVSHNYQFKIGCIETGT